MYQSKREEKTESVVNNYESNKAMVSRPQPHQPQLCQTRLDSYRASSGLVICRREIDAQSAASPLVEARPHSRSRWSCAWQESSGDMKATATHDIDTEEGMDFKTQYLKRMELVKPLARNSFFKETVELGSWRCGSKSS